MATRGGLSDGAVVRPWALGRGCYWGRLRGGGARAPQSSEPCWDPGLRRDTERELSGLGGLTRSQEERGEEGERLRRRRETRGSSNLDLP